MNFELSQILFYINPKIITIMIDYLDHIKNYLNIEFRMKVDLLSSNTTLLENSFVIFVQEINPMVVKKLQKCQFALLNTEQLSVEKYRKRVWQDINRYKVPVIDYSEENIFFLKKEYPWLKIIHFPFPISFNSQLDQKKTKLIISLQNSNDRKRICHKIGNINDFQNKWEKERNNLISEHKILLNLHYDKNYKIFESIRCYHALELKTLVISEPSIFQNELMLYDFIIFCPVEKIEEKIKEVEENYDIYFQQCFSESRIKEIENRTKKVYEENLKILFQN